MSIDPTTLSAMAASGDFSKFLEGLDANSIKALLTKAQESLKSVEQSQQKELEERHATALEPYKKSLADFDASEDATKKQYDDAIENIKTQRTAALEKLSEGRAKVLVSYNEQRKKYGLSEITATRQRRSSGPQHGYEVIFPLKGMDDKANPIYQLNGDNKFDYVDIRIDDNTETDRVAITNGNKADLKALSVILAARGVVDENGGRARGLANKIKNAAAKIYSPAKAEPATPAAAEPATPSA